MSVPLWKIAAPATLLLVAHPALASEHEAVRAAHLAFEQAMNAGNADAVAALIHPDYTSFTGNGGLLNERFDKNVLAANFGRGLSLATRSKHLDVQSWGDTALVTAYAEGTIRLPGATPRYEVSRVSAVYRRHDGRWKQVHIHQSPVLAPAIPQPGPAPTPQTRTGSDQPAPRQ